MKKIYLIAMCYEYEIFHGINAELHREIIGNWWKMLLSKDTLKKYDSYLKRVWQRGCFVG